MELILIKSEKMGELEKEIKAKGWKYIVSKEAVDEKSKIWDKWKNDNNVCPTCHQSLDKSS